MTTATTLVPKPPKYPPVSGAGLTHRGMVRTENEDAILTDPSGHLWAVADGMGGHGHGDVAADIAIDHLSRIDDGAEPGAALHDALMAANDEVIGRQGRDALGRMGTTVVAMFVRRAVAHIAWAGDSRAYLWRRGKLGMLTKDHSVVQELVDQGTLNPDDAELHPESHVITRAIGGERDLRVDLIAVPLSPGDRILLCSDGLSRVVHEPHIGAVLGEAETPADACRGLVQAALERGAPDNVSAIVVAVGEG